MKKQFNFKRIIALLTAFITVASLFTTTPIIVSAADSFSYFEDYDGGGSEGSYATGWAGPLWYNVAGDHGAPNLTRFVTPYGKNFNTTFTIPTKGTILNDTVCLSMDMKFDQDNANLLFIDESNREIFSFHRRGTSVLINATSAGADVKSFAPGITRADWFNLFAVIDFQTKMVRFKISTGLKGTQANLINDSIGFKDANATSFANFNITGGETNFDNISIIAPFDIGTPVISTQPQDVSVAINTPHQLSVVASSLDEANLSYQWYKNTTNSNEGGTPISGATSSTYSTSLNTAGMYYYYVTITNNNSGRFETTTSKAAALEAYEGSSLTENGITRVAKWNPITKILKVEQTTSSVGRNGDTNYIYAGKASVNDTLTSLTYSTSATGLTGNTTLNMLVDSNNYSEVTGSTLPSSGTLGDDATHGTNYGNALSTKGSLYNRGGNPEGHAARTFNLTDGATGSYYATISNSAALHASKQTGMMYFYGASRAERTYNAIAVYNLNNAIPTVITQQPYSIGLKPSIGQTTPLTVVARPGDATGTLHYQWYSYTGDAVTDKTSATAITGATNPSYNAPIGSNSTNHYFVKVKYDLYGFSIAGTEVESNVATVTVDNKIHAMIPTINTQPASIATPRNNGGNPLTLNIAATTTDSGELTYQWYKNSTKSNLGGTAIDNATTSSYSVPTNESGIFYYYVVVTNTITDNLDGGIKTAKATSEVAMVTIEQPINALVSTIGTNLPNNNLVVKDATHSLTVAATSTDGGDISYQWYKNSSRSNTGGTLIPDATSATYQVPATQSGFYYYYVNITNTITDNLDGGIKTNSVNSGVIEYIISDEALTTTNGVTTGAVINNITKTRTVVKIAQMGAVAAYLGKVVINDQLFELKIDVNQAAGVGDKNIRFDTRDFETATETPLPENGVLPNGGGDYFATTLKLLDGQRNAGVHTVNLLSNTFTSDILASNEVHLYGTASGTGGRRMTVKAVYSTDSATELSKTGNTITASYRVANQTVGTKITPYLAKYDLTGKLLMEVIVGNEITLTKTAQVLAPITMQDDANAIFKAFLWDDKMKLLTNNAVLE